MNQRVEGHMPYRLIEGNSAAIENQLGEVLADCLGGLCNSEGATARAALVLHACNNIERLEKVNEALVRLVEEYVALEEADHGLCFPNRDKIKAAREFLASLAKEPA